MSSYGPFLVAGVIPWQYNVVALVTQTSSLSGNRALIEKVYFPRWTLPLASLFAALFQYMIELGVLLLILSVIYQVPQVLLYIPLLIVVVALHSAFLFGAGLFLSILNSRYRDVEHILSLATQAWFWLTPIIYPLSLVEDGDASFLGIDLVTIYKLNPMVWFVDAYRALLYDVRVPDGTTFLAITLWAAATMTLGPLYFRRKQANIAEQL